MGVSAKPFVHRSTKVMRCVARPHRDAFGSSHCCRCSAPRNTAWQCAEIYPGLRCRPHGVSQSFTAERRTPWVGVDRLLLDVESRASGRHSSPCWRLGIGPEACTWALCDLLERGSSVERPRLAGSLLFLPVGSGAFVGSVALYGVESGAGRLGERGGSVEVVQRGSALRSGSGERDIRY